MYIMYKEIKKTNSQFNMIFYTIIYLTHAFISNFINNFFVADPTALKSFFFFILTNIVYEKRKKKKNI